MQRKRSACEEEEEEEEGEDRGEGLHGEPALKRVRGLSGLEGVAGLVERVLHPSYVPERLVGRQDRVQEVSALVGSLLREGRPGFAYLSGCPGSGKTACVRSVCGQLLVGDAWGHRASGGRKFGLAQGGGTKRGGGGNVWCAVCNCMRVERGRDLMRAVAAELGVEDVEELVRSGQRILLVLDEIDRLVGAHHTEKNPLRALGDLLEVKNSRLVVIGIGNLINLVDLCSFVEDPDKVNVFAFPPYTFKELKKIVRERLGSVPGSEALFRSEAIALCARKVAGISGDVRKVLDIIRKVLRNVRFAALEEGIGEEAVVKAMEQGEDEEDEEGEENKDGQQGLSEKTKGEGSRHLHQVSAMDILHSVKDVYRSPSESKLAGLPAQQQTLLCVVAAKLEHKGAMTLAQMWDHYCRFCDLRNHPKLLRREFDDTCRTLEDYGLMSIEKSKRLGSSPRGKRGGATSAGRGCRGGRGSSSMRSKGWSSPSGPLSVAGGSDSSLARLCVPYHEIKRYLGRVPFFKKILDASTANMPSGSLN